MRVMIFMDGEWMYRNMPRLREELQDQNYRLDYGKIPEVLKEVVSHELGGAEVDIVRTYLFGSYPINCAEEDKEEADSKLNFYMDRKEEHHYEVELYPIDFRGHRLRAKDREETEWEPKEKCVDVALASTMLFYAAIPHVYDIAIAVIGDSDFKPVLQHVRRLGKRVMIATIGGSCAKQFYEPTDPERIRDFDTVFLNDLLDKLRLTYKKRLLRCSSCRTPFWSEFQPHKGQRAYCGRCKAEYRRQRLAPQGAVEEEAEPSQKARVEMEYLPTLSVSAIEEGIEPSQKTLP